MKLGGRNRQTGDGLVEATSVTVSRRSNTCRPSAVFSLFSRVLIAGLVVIVVSGCGRYKQDLEEAKKRIDTLTADNRKCAEISASLEKDKQRLGEERQAIDTRLETLIKEVGNLNKTNAALKDELGKLKKRNGELSADVKALQRDKADLSKKLDEMKNRTAELPKPTLPPVTGPRETTPVSGSEATVPKTPKKMTPCDEIIAYMKATEQIVRRYKGAERATMLQKLKEEYEPRIKNAPERAKKNAEAWVEEAARSWDNMGDDFVFNLLTKRNAVLESCGKKPAESGF